jgi:hypothetical protein
MKFTAQIIRVATESLKVVVPWSDIPPDIKRLFFARAERPQPEEWDEEEVDNYKMSPRSTDARTPIRFYGNTHTVSMIQDEPPFASASYLSFDNQEEVKTLLRFMSTYKNKEGNPR